MSIGDRDVLITIEGATEAIAPTGFVVETFAPLPPPIWARREAAAPSGEPFTGDQIVGRESTIWTVPYRADLDPDGVDVPKLRRVTYAGAVYDIVSASLLSRRGLIRLATRVGGQA